MADKSEKLKKLLRFASEQNASDIHFCVGHLPIIRVSGNLRRIEGEDMLTDEDLDSFAQVMLPKNKFERMIEEREIDFSYSFENKIRFRGNIYYQMNRLSCSLRIISNNIKTLEELNLPSVLHSFTKPMQGFVLVTGPANQGKSTTLAALVDEINHEREEHIITIEDPIEYIFSDDKCIIDQREVGKDTLSFAKALRSSLRQDPDVIMVGEMRDLETIAIALTAAETGHLVFATLHTNSAAQTIHRIVDSFPASQQNQVRSQLSSSLLGVVSQRLVPGAKGGLFSACEVLMNTPAVANLVRENKIYEIPSVVETSSDIGMISLNRALAELVRQGKVSLDVAIDFSLNPKGLKDLVKAQYEI